MAAVARTVATNGTAPEFREQMSDEYEAFVAMLEAADPAGYAATCRAIAALDMSGRLERIAVPVLLVGGIADGVAPPEAQVATAEKIADAWYLEVPHCGHIAPLERTHSSDAASASAYRSPCTTSSAPQARMSAILAGEQTVGTKIRAGTPSRLAA